MELDEMELMATKVVNGVEKVGIGDLIKKMERLKKRNCENYSSEQKLRDAIFLTVLDLNENTDFNKIYEDYHYIETVVSNLDQFKPLIDKFRELDTKEPKDKKIKYVEELER